MVAIKPLQPVPKCVDCLISLAKDVVALTAPEDYSLIEKAESIANEYIWLSKAARPSTI